jgi:hypothetical protein
MRLPELLIVAATMNVAFVAYWDGASDAEQDGDHMPPASLAFH